MAVAAAASIVSVVSLIAYVTRDEGRTSHRLEGPELVAFDAAVGAASVANPPRDEVEPASPPVSIAIPSIGVVAPVTRLRLERDGTLEVPESFSETGWWSGGFKPGQTGAAVIVGHVDSKSGPAVFANLQEVERGDLVQVTGRDGTALEFEVKRIEEHDKDEFPTNQVYTETRDPELRLLTCAGKFDDSKGHYDRNVIVWASQVRT